jgi:hypothetical protein
VRPLLVVLCDGKAFHDGVLYQVAEGVEVPRILESYWVVVDDPDLGCESALLFFSGGGRFTQFITPALAGMV